MNPFKIIWGLLFRLFPCPTKVGLQPIGKPGPDSPALLTCNFDLTVRRLKRHLRGLDLWLLIAESKGVNVWCAAGGEEFNTHSVVSALKTSGIEDKVNHRTIILPPLGAPGINKTDVEKQTGWTVKWGPVYAKDIADYIRYHCERTEKMKRVSYNLGERLDTSLGSLFPFFALGAAGFLIFGRHLLLDYFLIGALAFLIFMSLVPWLPGKTGLLKALFLDLVIVGLLISVRFTFNLEGELFSANTIIALAVIPLYGLELGGLASTMPSDLDPFLARLGIGAIGNAAFAGTIRTELLNGYRELSYDRERCIGCRSCSEVCPQGVWEMDENSMAVLTRRNACTACRACLVQCQNGAIQAPRIQSKAV